MEMQNFIGRVGLERVFTHMGGTRSPIVLIAVVRAMIQRGVDIPLLNVLWLSKESLATDPRDRVFALCGLATDTSASRLNVDINYSPTNSVQDCFRKTAIAMLSNSRSLDILTVPRRLCRLNPFEIPSWVPDWSSNHKIYPLQEENLRIPSDVLPRSYFKAAASTEYDIALSAEERELIVTGVYVDSIDKVGHICDFSESSGSTEKVRRDTERTLNWMDITGAKSSRLYTNGETCLDAYWQTFYGGHYGISYEEAKSLFFEHYGLMERNYLWQRLGVSQYPSLLGAVNTVDVGVKYLFGGGFKNVGRHHLLMAIQRFRRMGVSKTGYFLLAPAIAEPRDCIFVLKGSNVPLLLRRSATGSWELIGETYVHGIMKGEAWSESNCETINIC
jgi:hypothetical protein